MKILVACEMSQAVTMAFVEKGHTVYSCDILDTVGPRPDLHLKQDVRNVLPLQWDMLIAFPPCTYLANSGARWLYNKDKTKNIQRWMDMRAGAHFFKLFLQQDHIPKICVENPVQHGHAKKIINQDFTHSIQPWQYGHGYCKRTCFWLKGLPDLQPTEIVEGREQTIHRLPPGKDRAMLRSLTPQGVALAMADQWGTK